MQLIIDAGTIEELMEKVCAIANKFGVDLSESTKTPVTEAVVEAAKTIEVEPEEPVKKERKKKNVILEAATEAAKTGAETVVVEVKTYTKQDIANACQRVSEAKGLELAREILGTFGAKRISEVKEEDYAKFIEACEGCLK